MTKQFDIDLKKRVNVFSIVLASFGVAKDTIVAFENLFCLIKKKKNGEKLAGTCWNQHVVVERVAEFLPPKKKNRSEWD